MVKKTQLLIISLIIIILTNFANSNNLKTENDNKLNGLDATIQQLYSKLIGEQAPNDQSQSFFPPRFQEFKGIFRSYIHLNIVDSKNSFFSHVARTYGAIGDMNMFVSNFAVLNLLESFSLNTINLDVNSIKSAFKSMLLFQDKNYNGFPVYGFWNQELKGNVWSQHPININRAIDIIPRTPKFVTNFLKRFAATKSIAETIEGFNMFFDAFDSIARIPPDTDDTSVNLALTGLLYDYSSKFDNIKNISKDWLNANQKIKELFSVYKKYAYLPFFNETIYSNTTEYNYQDLLDPRSYFVQVGFLDKQKQLNNTNIILPATWLSDLNIQKKLVDIVSMPFNVNNVDLTVSANFLFGVSNIVLHHVDKDYILEAFDEEMQIMYTSAVDLAIYVIENDLAFKRTDLTLVYYPSILDFYWMTSRVYAALKENKSNERFSLFKTNYEKIETVLKAYATKQILNSIISVDDTQAYAEEFLGNTKDYKRGEDRLFSTGLAINALLDIYTVKIKNDSGKVYLQWEDDTDNLVKETIDKLKNYVQQNIFKYNTSKENVFFSGSMKGPKTMPYVYPGNFYRYLNGTEFSKDMNKSNVGPDPVVGVHGFIEQKEYERMLNETYFGDRVPLVKTNFEEVLFPYWSSPAITYSINLLAMSKIKSLK